MEKTYDPRSVERKIYDLWLENGCFTADPNAEGEPFTIVMPPPNVTGQLHLGHAFDQTLQDILTRYKRMRGFNTLWVPGIDHAGIATQIRVEQDLRKREGKSRHDLGREKFLELVWDWKNKFGDRILLQSRALGSSCDWSRTRFTMDEGCSRAVREVFVRLHEQGLIYKGRRIINWCPKCQTALSDTEVVHEQETGHLWHIKYPIADSDEYIVVATTRPETMLGDTAVAVHPEDERYTHLAGKFVALPLTDRLIPIVADEYVEREFGTGAVKITPAHDPNDFEVAERQNLPMIILESELLGEKARQNVVEKLQNLGLLIKIEEHSHNVGHCDRCKTAVEPLASEQWFVKMKPLAEPAIKAVRDGDVKFVPEHSAKIYLNWMENVRDWCVSRQLWWGHRIPAWHCADCGEYTVTRDDPQACIHCGSKNITQEADVLDTWFSSALWPFSTLGWPDDTPELAKYYPTSVLVTGYEIIFLWVARMIFSGINYLGKPPFHTVLIHGIMRDNKGRKMSKSLDNGIDPIDVIDKFGADALRLNIVTGVSPGNDTRFFEERCQAMAEFLNKLWNAARFTMMKMENSEKSELSIADKWILSRLSAVSREVTENLEKYELGVAAGKLYDFVWTEFCDWYIELVKTQCNFDTLIYVLQNILKLLHPFIPHITEEIWQTAGEGFLIGAKWETPCYDYDTADMEDVIEIIKAIRSRRAELKVPPSKKAAITVVSDLRTGGEYIAKLAGGSEVIFAESHTGTPIAATARAKIYIPLGDLTDISAERERVRKEIEKNAKEIAALSAKLQNPGFTEKAPPKVVEGERARLASLQSLAAKLGESLNVLG